MAQKESRNLSDRFLKYTGISSLSLLVDLATFHVLTNFEDFSVPVVATISYGAGLVFGYYIFVLTIFRHTRFSHRKILQASLFIFSGLLGSATTYLVSGTTFNYLGATRWESKLSAVACSFLLVYLFRTKFVFASGGGERIYE